MIQAGRRRRFHDEPAVGSEIFVPQTGQWCVEIPRQAFDCLAQSRLVAVVTVNEISTYPLGLRPKPRDWVSNAAVQFDAVDRDPTLPINAVSVGELYELWHLRRPVVAGHFGPAGQAEMPIRSDGQARGSHPAFRKRLSNRRQTIHATRRYCDR